MDVRVDPLAADSGRITGNSPEQTRKSFVSCHHLQPAPGCPMLGSKSVGRRAAVSSTVVE